MTTSDEKIPDVLRWLALHLPQWPWCIGSANELLESLPDKAFYDPAGNTIDGYSKLEWKSARQKLGLDYPDSAKATLEPTPEEDEAFEAMSRNSDKPTAADILKAGQGHMEDRAKTYDKPQGERSMGATVAAFKAVTGIQMTEEQGWMFMILLKAVRSQQGEFKLDNYEDLAAYPGLCGEAAARERG